MDKAEELTNQMHKNIQETEQETVGSLSMGCTTENLAGEGIICNSGEDIYIANKPRRGCISKNDEMVFEYKTDDNTNINISGLNVWDGWIYYILNDSNDSEYTGCELRRVRVDGTKDMSMGIKMDVHKIAVMNNRLYLAADVYPGDQERGLFTCDLNGENLHCLDKKAGSNNFASNGEKIYYTEMAEAAYADPDYSPSYMIKEYDINSRKISNITSGDSEEILLYESSLIFTKIKSDKIYICKYDITSQKEEYLQSVKNIDPILAIHDNYLYCFEDEYNSAQSNPDGYDFNINAYDLKNGKWDDSKTFSHLFKEELKLDEIEGKGDIYYGMDAVCISGNRLYYKLFRRADRPKKYNVGDVAGDFYGNMNLSGKDNKMYGD